MFKTGMVIKVFPDTNVGIYTDWIRQEGYNFRVYRDRIEVIGRTYKLVDRVEMGMINGAVTYPEKEKDLKRCTMFFSNNLKNSDLL